MASLEQRAVLHLKLSRRDMLWMKIGIAGAFPIEIVQRWSMERPAKCSAGIELLDRFVFQCKLWKELRACKIGKPFEAERRRCRPMRNRLEFYRRVSCDLIPVDNRNIRSKRVGIPRKLRVNDVTTCIKTCPTRDRHNGTKMEREHSCKP